jgi:hypothetical protein
MTEISLLDIIKHKKFGTIILGDSKEKVIGILGTPDGYSNPEAYPEFHEAILYDRFEFNFAKNKLVSISHGYILNNRNWRFNRNFHFKNDKFKFTSWFKKTWIDTKLENFKKKLDYERIQYYEDVNYDCARLKIGDNLIILFCSKLSYHEDPEIWTKIDPKILNLRLSNFYLSLCD